MSDKEERTYKFKTSRGFNSMGEEDYTIHKIKESDLSQAQIDLLAGDMIKQFNELPQASKMIVWYKMSERLSEGMERTFTSDIQKEMNNLTEDDYLDNRYPTHGEDD